MARRSYRRPSYSHAAPTSGYWTQEVPTGGPEGMRVGDYVVKHYPQAGKLQTYNWIESSGYTGLSKGVVLHLDKYTAEELDGLRSMILGVIDTEKARRAGTARVGATFTQPAPEPQPVPVQPRVGAVFTPAQPASDPSRFKALFEKLRLKAVAV